jgi:hypothetical protein
LQTELRKHGYKCEPDGGELKIRKNGLPVAVALESGELAAYKNTLNDYEYQQIRSIYDSLYEAYSLYEKGEPLLSQPNFHKLCEFGNYVLGAKIMGYGCMEFATWKQSADRMRTDIGNYMDNYEKAKEDFSTRAGLIDRYKMFSETEMKLIRQGLVHLGANFPDLTYDQNNILGKVVEKIETIVPSIQERSVYECYELVPQDGFEV